MFRKSYPANYHSARPGIGIKTLTYAERTLLVEVFLEKGSSLPRHSHPHEQTGYMVSGHFKLTIAGEVFDAHPGDSWAIPGNVEHSVEVLEDTVVVEVFAPVREDYLPYYREPETIS